MSQLCFWHFLSNCLLFSDSTLRRKVWMSSSLLFSCSHLFCFDDDIRADSRWRSQSKLHIKAVELWMAAKIASGSPKRSCCRCDGKMLNVKSKCLSETVTLSDRLSLVSYWVPTVRLCCLRGGLKVSCVFVLVWVCLWSIFSSSRPFFLSAPPMSVSPSPLRGSPAVTSPLINLSKTFLSLLLKGQRLKKKVWETKMIFFQVF